ncbi:MAG TPA: exodeoxyribonuclease VII large subunit [Terracidiphilus sp.]|nr:exodeoxyribonuclease VII large subunit [Terracidiphilus sp.]
MPPRDTSTRQLDLLFEEERSVRRIWPVRELVERVRELVEAQYSDLWVEGEISNLRQAPSGHVYFTVKDAEAQLPVVMFRRQTLLLRFQPKDGLHVLVRGRVSIYENRGQLQLVAEAIEPVGAGSLQLAFEQLKEKLRAEGMFEAGRKRPLPEFPRTVGIITSPTGAVVRDFLNIIARRHSGLNVLLFPVSVQGESAPAEIETALAALNESGLADLIVLARGGGSLEDMAAFNNEQVARAIAASDLPVVSAIGHETDFTIADFVADLRAPTPSAAAELVTEAQHKIADYMANQIIRLERASRFQLLRARGRFDALPVDRAGGRMAALIHRLEQRVDDLTFRLESCLEARLDSYLRRSAELEAAVLRHDPRRGLAIVGERLAANRKRLEHAVYACLQNIAQGVKALDQQLTALSPHAVLERGYALVLTADGALIRSTKQLAVGDRVTTRLNEGAFIGRVETTMESALETRGNSRGK